jgi:hypothetical protein
LVRDTERHNRYNKRRRHEGVEGLLCQQQKRSSAGGSVRASVQGEQSISTRD